MISFLTRRPIAHRGLHNKTTIIENTPSAFRAAIAGNYAIECDIQRSRDGEAMVFHDFTLDRLTVAKGDVASLTAAELQAISFKDSGDKMLTLQGLLDLTAGQVPLVIEIKSNFTGDLALSERAIEVLAGYKHEFALMSFDPLVVKHLRLFAPQMVRGIVSQNTYTGAEWANISDEGKRDMRELTHFPDTDPHFLSWKVKDCPTAATTLFQKALNRPVICWTVRTDEDKAMAARYADQVTFEGYVA